MSDINLSMQRQIQALQDELERLRKPDVAALYLPWTQRAVNPLTASQTWADMPLPWAIYLLAFYATVYVTATSNATNYWTISLLDQPVGVTLASFDTKTVAANTFTRITPPAITQPDASALSVAIVATKTLVPGPLYLLPAVALLRTG